MLQSAVDSVIVLDLYLLFISSFLNKFLLLSLFSCLLLSYEIQFHAIQYGLS